jgi:DNA-binding CsgD family transcriptional regulator
MFLFQRVLRKVRAWFKREPSAAPTTFNLDIETLRSIEYIAELEQRTPEDVANQILEDVLRNHQAQQENWQKWQALTPREQEVAALICLNYTSRQIAAKLHISPETVKTHVEHILMKFDVSDRNALRVLLSHWSFSDWDR